MSKDELPSLNDYLEKDDLPSYNDYLEESDLPSCNDHLEESDLPSYKDFIEKKGELPSVNEYILETSIDEEDLPSVEDFIEKVEEVTEEPVVLEETTDDLTEILHLIEEVRKDIPEIPEIKYYDDELEKISAYIEQVKEGIPEVRYYDNEVESICEQIDQVREEVKDLPEVKYYDEDIESLNDNIEVVRNEVVSNINIVKEDISTNIENNLIKIDDRLNNIKLNFDSNIDQFSEKLNVSDFETKIDIKNLNLNIEETKSKISEELKETSEKIWSHHNEFKDDDRKLKKQILGQYNTLKENIEKQIEDFNEKNIKSQNIITGSLKDYFDTLKEDIKNLPEVKYYDEEIDEIKSDINSLQLLKRNVKELKETQKEFQDTQKEFQEKLEEGLLNIPPQENNSDPLTPLDHNFVTLDQLQEHYRLFVNRVQQQLASLGGGGEVWLKYLNDVGISTQSITDGWVLTWNESQSKWLGAASAGGGGGGSVSGGLWEKTNAGINTVSNVGIGTTNPRFLLEVGSVGASGTSLFVNGDARVTGILSVGEGTITLDPDSKTISGLDELKIGSGANLITLKRGSSGRVEFLDVDGTESSVGIGTTLSINTTGIITASSFKGTWQGTAIADGYIASSATWNAKQSALTFGIANTNSLKVDDADAADNDYAKFTSTGIEGRSYAELKSDISLDNVENTALSTWAGTSNITTLGTIATGTWQGTDIVDDYIASSGTWNAKQNALTFGIANTNTVKIDSADVADDEYARFTASGLEGRTTAELKSDLSLNLVENTALSTWAGTSNITTLGTIATGTWQGTAIADGYLASTFLKNVVEDTTPQLGGNLDLNSKNITGTGNIDVTGNIECTGNVSVGGTLTYEDVTNVDSVGLITARSGINVTGGDIKVGTSVTISNGGNVTLGTITSGTWNGTAIADGYIASSGTWDGKQDALTFGIANTNAVKIDDADAADNDYAKFTASGIEGRSAAEVKTDLSLNNVENTALSTWAGTSNITTLGTIATGTWQGTAVADAYVASASTWDGKQDALTFGLSNGNALKSEEALTTNDVLLAGTSNIKGRTYAEFKTDLSLNNVENTAVSTWAGTSNITTLGTIATGTWNGTAIADGYIASSGTWDAKQNALTFGLSSGNALKSEEALTTNDVLLAGTSNIKGRTYTEFKSDLSLNNVENTALSTWVGTSNVTTLGTIATGTWQGTAVADSYVASSATWNAKQSALTFGIADTNAVKIDSGDVGDDEYARFTSSGLEGRTSAELKSDLSLSKSDVGLGNVENTALSTWAGTSNVTTLGTIATGTWQGTAIADGYVASASTWDAKQNALTFGLSSGNALKSEEALTTNDVLLAGATNIKGRTYTEFKSDLSLNLVENTALSTWAGTSNITTLGTIATGTWNGTAIADGYIASSGTWDGKQDALTFGIANTNALKVDDADAADDDYAKFTATGIEGRSAAEVKTDLVLNNVENTSLSTWAGSANITTLGTIATGTWNGTAVADSYVASSSTWNAKLSDVVDDTTPQLGGNLDLNSNDITGAGNIDITGTLSIKSDSRIMSMIGNDLMVDISTIGGGADINDKRVMILHHDSSAGTTGAKLMTHGWGVGVVGVCSVTGATHATSFVKTGGTSSQYLMADGTTSTGGGGGGGGITVGKSIMMSMIFG